MATLPSKSFPPSWYKHLVVPNKSMTTLPTNSTILYPPPPPNNQRRPFLTPIPNLPGEFLLVLDNTALDHVKRCHKNGQIYLILGREARPRNAALAYGGAIHQGLEVFHKHQWIKGKEEANEKTEEQFGKAAQDQAILSYFASNPAPANDYRTPAAALEVLTHYRRRCNPDLYPDYDWEILSDANGPIIERPFEIPMGVMDVDFHVPVDKDKIEEGEEPVWSDLHGSYSHRVSRIHLAWSGRIDLIARINGLPHIVDHKTSSIDETKHTEGFPLASQVIGYIFAYREMASRGLLPDFNISHFCLNAINLKRPLVKAPLSMIERGPRGGDPQLSFYRAYFQYSEDRISRWLNDTKLLIEDFLHSVSRAHFPLNDRACFDKYGRCPYWDACTIDKEEIGDKFLMSEAYKEVTWNPTV